jgi:hypothetical protein
MNSSLYACTYVHVNCSQAVNIILKFCTVEPPNREHFGDDLNSADIFFVERLSPFGGLKCIEL